MNRTLWVTLLAVVAGFSLGLGYAWVISPIRYIDTTPDTLRADFKDTFREAIAASYSANHNLDRARARLRLLGDPDPVEALTAQAQRMLASGQSFALIQQVAGLASDLRSGVASIPPSVTSSPFTATPVFLGTPTALASATGLVDLSSESTPTESLASPLPVVTATARPTRTPIPTASAPFQLVSNDEVCNPSLTNGLLQVSILDSHHHQMPGVEIDIAWNGGEEQFFTGLKPEIADGYADYVMQAGVTYSVRVERAGTAVSDLSAPACPDTNGQTYVGGRRLVFQQP